MRQLVSIPGDERDLRPDRHRRDLEAGRRRAGDDRVDRQGPALAVREDRDRHVGRGRRDVERPERVAELVDRDQLHVVGDVDAGRLDDDVRAYGVDLGQDRRSPGDRDRGGKDRGRTERQAVGDRAVGDLTGPISRWSLSSSRVAKAGSYPRTRIRESGVVTLIGTLTTPVVFGETGQIDGGEEGSGRDADPVRGVVANER